MNKKQIPWTRVIAEFVAILAGITVALLADDWRDFRNDRQEEATALRQILSDLSTDSTALGGHLRAIDRQREGALWAWKNQGREAPPDSVRLAIDRIATYYLYQPVRAAYLGSRDTGRLALVRDDELRRRIVEYHEGTQPWILDYGERYWEARDHLYHALFKNIRSVPDTTAELYQFDHLEFPVPWRRFSGLSDFEYRLTEFGSHAWLFSESLVGIMERNSQLRGLIEEYLRNE